MRKPSSARQALIAQCLINGSGIKGVVRVCCMCERTALQLLAVVCSLFRDLHDLIVRES